MPSRRTSRMRRWALGGLGALAATPALANPKWVHGHGLMLAADTRNEGRGAVGWESSLNAMSDLFSGVGGVMQVELDFDGGVRLALLGQGFYGPVGAELGPALYLDPVDGLGLELQLAPFLSMGLLTVAGRLLVTGAGAHYGGSMALKLHVDGEGDLYPWSTLGGGGCEDYEPDPDSAVVCGRPLRVADGQGWRAPVVIGGAARRDATWAAAEQLDGATRCRLASAWLDDARDEHAAIGAFVQLAAHLAAHDAPRPLIEGAKQAARDEVRHARRAFAIASALAGRRLAPVSIGVPGRATPSRAALAAESWLDGAMNEGRAAAEARVGHATARVSAVRGLLGAIGREEARHAALGAAVAEWAAGEGRAARQALAAARDVRAMVEPPRAADGMADGMWGRVG